MQLEKGGFPKLWSVEQAVVMSPSGIFFHHYGCSTGLQEKRKSKIIADSCSQQIKPAVRVVIEITVSGNFFDIPAFGPVHANVCIVQLALNTGSVRNFADGLQISNGGVRFFYITLASYKIILFICIISHFMSVFYLMTKSSKSQGT